MTTPELVTGLREMASQILSPQSAGKQFFEEVADRLERLEVDVENQCKIKEAEKEILLAEIAKSKHRLDVLRLHHKWHQEYDEYGGYPDSELCDKTIDALRLL